jgi:hypothetical protein
MLTQGAKLYGATGLAGQTGRETEKLEAALSS